MEPEYNEQGQHVVSNKLSWSTTLLLRFTIQSQRKSAKKTMHKISWLSISPFYQRHLFAQVILWKKKESTLAILDFFLHLWTSYIYPISISETSRHSITVKFYKLTLKLCKEINTIGYTEFQTYCTMPISDSGGWIVYVVVLMEGI